MKQLLVFLILLSPVLTMAQAVVNHVRAAQRTGTKLVDIHYSLSASASVSVAVSDDGGNTYVVPASSFSGDAGVLVTSGTNKHIVWDAEADWNDRTSATMKFRITATGVLPSPDDLVMIPGGDFSMGDSFGEGDSDEQPVRTVSLADFRMGKYEVTKALWDQVQAWAINHGYTDLPTGSGKGVVHPVHSINWYAMVKWCNARSERDGLTPCYTVDDVVFRMGESDTVECDWSASGYRLPAEAEWERAARGGQDGKRFPWGDVISLAEANYRSLDVEYDLGGGVGYHPDYASDGTPYTSPVGSFAANGYGLHDITGNVWEWCWEWHTKPITIRRQPLSQIINLGANASFMVAGSPTEDISVRWKKNGVFVTQASADLEYEVNSTSYDDARLYQARITGSGSIVSSEEAYLVVIDKSPQAETAPRRSSVVLLGRAKAPVGAVGAFQWFRDGNALPNFGRFLADELIEDNQRTPRLTIATFDVFDQGNYTCRYQDFPRGLEGETGPISLSIAAPPPAPPEMGGSETVVVSTTGTTSPAPTQGTVLLSPTPSPADATHRVLRGGSWVNEAFFCRTSYRNIKAPSTTSNRVGFRVAATSMPANPYSDIVAIDTQGPGTVKLTGRVLDEESGIPLAGVTITIGGLTRITGPNGTFVISNVELPLGGSTLSASADHYLTQTISVTAGENQKAVDVGDVRLVRDTENPVVEGLSLDPNGIFLAGFGLSPNLKAKINWNKNTPSSVEITVNGALYSVLQGERSEYSISIPVDSVLRASFSEASNVISVVAVAEEHGKVSKPNRLVVPVVPVPPGLRSMSTLFQKYGPDRVGLDFDLSTHKKEINLPVLGKFGFEWGANACFDYEVKEGKWEIGLGRQAEGQQGMRGTRPNFPGLLRYPKASLYIGDKIINASISGKAKGTATLAAGVALNTIGLEASLKTKIELTRLGLADIFGPGWTNVISLNPLAGKLLKNVSVTLWLIPELGGTASVNYSPFDFNEATLTGAIGLEAAYEPNIGDVFKGRFFIGSRNALTVGLPPPVLKNVNFKAYAGYELKVFSVTASWEYPFIDESYSSGASLDSGTGYRLAWANQPAAWRPMERPWRKAGKEEFIVASADDGLQMDTALMTDAEMFVRIGNSVGLGSVLKPL